MTSTNTTLAAVLLLVAACHPQPEGPCQPGDATFSTLIGTVTTQGGMDEPFDVTDMSGTAPCTVSSRPSGDRNADDATRTTVDLTCESQGERLSLTFEIDDVRPLGAGAHELSTDDHGLRISYRPSASAPECYTYLADTEYRAMVSEAVGEAAPYPTLVTSDFHRRFAISLDLALQNHSAKQYTNGVVESCSLDFTGSIAFTAVLDAADYQARGTDTCVFE